MARACSEWLAGLLWLALLIGCEAANPDASSSAAAPAASPKPSGIRGELHQRLLGTWRGEVVGKSADRLKAARLFLQEEEPTEQQLSSVDEELRAQIRAQRAKLAQASEGEARLLQNMTTMMLQVFSDLRMEITADSMKLHMGGDSGKTQEFGYEVVRAQGDELVLRTKDGGERTDESKIIFESPDAFVTKRTMGKNDFELRFTRSSE